MAPKRKEVQGTGAEHVGPADRAEIEAGGRADRADAADSAAGVVVGAADILSSNAEDLKETIKYEDFLKLSLDERLRMVSDIDSAAKLKEGAEVTFNFGKNEILEYEVGLGDLMPPELRKISVDGLVYERRGNQGFFNEGDYLAIFNGTTIRVESFDAAYSSGNEYVGKFGGGYESIDDKVFSADKETLVSKNQVFEAAVEYQIDAYFLEAVFSVMKDSFRERQDSEVEFLRMAARYIQNAEAKYGQSTIKDGHYDEKFIVYALDRFNLFAEFKVVQAEMVIKAVAAKYAGLRGIDLQITEEAKVDDFREVPAAASDLTGPSAGVLAELPSRFERVDSNEVFERGVDHFGNVVVLRRSALKAFNEAKKIAESFSPRVRLMVNSSYRDYDDQKQLWEKALEKYKDPKIADNWVARPGGSVHHTGGAIDVTAFVQGKKRPDMLRTIMTTAGFVNYEREPWHWEIYTRRFQKAANYSGPLYRYVVSMG